MEAGAEGWGAGTLRYSFHAQLKLSAASGREDLHLVDPVDDVCCRMGLTDPP